MLVRLLKTYLAKYRWLLVAVVLLQLVQTTCTLYLPSLNAKIIDKGIVTGNHGYIWKIGLVMLGITFVQVCFSICAVYFGSRTAMGFGRDVRSGLFHKVTDFSTQEVAIYGAPSLITRITNDVQQVQMLVLMTCTLLVAAPITIVGGVIMALREDVGLSGILLVSVPALTIGVGLVIGRMIPLFRVMQERIDGINRVLREQITGIRVVRAFVREPDETKRFESVNQDLTDTSLLAGRLMAFMFPIVTVILNASNVAALWIGANRINSGQMTIGSLIAFLSYLAQILMSVMMASFMAVMVPRAAVCAERIQEVLDTESSVVSAANPVRSVNIAGSLEFRNVGFHYPGAEAPVLNNISFTSLAGQMTAIIGSTGSGKTSLINLVPRLADATSGAILVDGVDVRELDPDLLWERIGIVPQKPYLFSGSVASNLRYGKPDATDAELWEALEVAQARDFVASMPGGLDARIAQGGTNVSGGQRQRLAIARALVRKPEIYLFDDSFSALDLSTDARLRAALAPHTAESTVIIVAQRVSTIRHADQILVLEDGQTVGLGTHDALLESCPTYAEIVASQVQAEVAA
ncbi:MAG: multidrug transporter ATP-binding protein [Acidimicrobiales bacterium]|nr:multidrug transporter ATP-binding protein [Acidimicrobiales bacterium]